MFNEKTMDLMLIVPTGMSDMDQNFFQMTLHAMFSMTGE